MVGRYCHYLLPYCPEKVAELSQREVLIDQMDPISALATSLIIPAFKRDFISELEEEPGHEGEALRDRVPVGGGEEEGGHEQEGEEGRPRHRRKHLLQRGHSHVTSILRRGGFNLSVDTLLRNKMNYAAGLLEE